MVKNSDSDLDSLFIEIASDARRKILSTLEQKPQKLSQIAKDLDLTIQEAHRNSARLAKSGLIEKNPDGTLSLTSYGRMISKQIGSFEFMMHHRKYFQKHTTGDLPDKFVKRIGDLSSLEIIHGIGPVLEHWKKIMNNATQYINLISSQYPMDVAKACAQKAKDGIPLSYIFGHNTLVPKEREKLLEKTSWKKLVVSGQVKRKMIQNAQVCTTITDVEACVYFPGLDGQTDMTSGFFSGDIKFREWCSDFFNYQWENAGSFDESKLTNL